jgi:hypothetical protein
MAPIFAKAQMAGLLYIYLPMTIKNIDYETISRVKVPNSQKARSLTINQEVPK